MFINKNNGYTNYATFISGIAVSNKKTWPTFLHNKSQKIEDEAEEARYKRLCIVWACYYKVLKQSKLIHCDRNQISDCLGLRGWGGKVSGNWLKGLSRNSGLNEMLYFFFFYGGGSYMSVYNCQNLSSATLKSTQFVCKLNLKENKEIKIIGTLSSHSVLEWDIC